MTSRVDVVVVGAGPAGSAAAATLARAGRRVALVDRAKAPRRKVGEALPAAAKPLLRRLGFLDAVERGPHLPCPGNVSSWGKDELEATDFLRDPQGMGWHLDRPAFDRNLRAAAVRAGAANVEGFVRNLKREEDGWRMSAGDEALACRWLIDATGRGAALARRHGGRRAVDDALGALVAYAEPRADDHDQRTLLEAVENGWWYTAKLPDGARVVVFHGLEPVPAAFFRALEATRHMGAWLSDARWLGAPRLVEASGSALDLPFGDGWVAAGDAAMAFDPLSSQGIFNALYSGMRAGEAVDALLDDDEKPAVDYARRLAAVRQVYLARRAVYYGAETRWPRSDFWRSLRVQRDLGPALGQLLKGPAVDHLALVQDQDLIATL